MLKIGFHGFPKISSHDLCISSVSTLVRHLKNYSKSAEIVQPVNIAYSSYETADTRKGNDGKNFPIIIMHGLLGSKNNWNSLSKTIHSRTQHKVIAVDARNHGDSPQTEEFNYSVLAEDLRALLDNLNIVKINALGHSLGGRAMMFLALKYPHLINSLIVVDISPVQTSPMISDLKDMLNTMASIKLDSKIPLSTARQNVDLLLKETVPDPYVRQFLLTNLVKVQGGHYKWRVNIGSLLDNFSSVVNFKPPNGKFRGPTLFIGGEKSSYLPKQDHEGILKLFPNAQFSYIQDAGHWVHSEKPVEFLDLVCEFLKKSDK